MIVLLSGGLDSIAAWRLLGLPRAINFDLGTQAAWREEGAINWAAEHFVADYTSLRVPMHMSEADNGWVDFRNSILLLLAAQHDADGEVVLGAVAEYAPDKNDRFYKRLERAVNERGAAAGNAKQLTVLTPYADVSKGELLWLYHCRFGASEARLLLDNTWSCYRHGKNPCLSCGGCRQRIAAEHQYARLSGTEAPLYTTSRWRIPWRDRLLWVAANGYRGVQQIRAHTRQDRCLPVL